MLFCSIKNYIYNSWEKNMEDLDNFELIFRILKIELILFCENVTGDYALELKICRNRRDRQQVWDSEILYYYIYILYYYLKK